MNFAVTVLEPAISSRNSRNPDSRRLIQDAIRATASKRRAIAFTLDLHPIAITSRTIAKAQATCSGIEGRVTTPEGWLIPMARIFFFNKETKKNTSADRNEEGLYDACLAPGTYDVTVNAPGFKSAKRKGIQVFHGERRMVDFPLKRGRPQTSH